MERATGMMFVLKDWNISLCWNEELTTEELEGLVRVSAEKVKPLMPFCSAQKEAMLKGFPVGRHQKPRTEPDPEPDATLSQVESGRQAVLARLPGVPEARVLPGLKAKTRASGKEDAEEAATKEKSSQEKAVSRAKRQREQDMATAMAKAAKVPKKRAGLAKPAAGKEKKKDIGGVDLGFLGEDEEEPEGL